MKKHLFYTLLVAFAVTAIITLLGVTEVIRIRDGYLTPLVGAFLVELGATIFAIAKREDLLEEQKPESRPIVGPPAGNPIEVISAQYGSDFSQADVTAIVRGHVDNGILNILATTGVLGVVDPLYGRKKELTVVCLLYGRERTFHVPEGRRLIVP